MADETAEPAKGTEEKAEEAKGGEKDAKAAEVKTDADIEAIAAQAKNPDAVRNALQAERAEKKAEHDRANAAEAKVKEFEDATKTEQEKKAEALKAADGRATSAEAKLLRYQVATAKKLPLELADRLQGKNEKELGEDADRLLELVKPNGQVAGDGDAGKGEAAEGGSFNDALRAGAHK